MITLEAFSEDVPTAAVSLLEELGSGEAGFGGTEYGRGEMALLEYLRHTAGETDRANLPPGRVPQTTFWILDKGAAVGLLRMRHVLNDYTRVKGGHIGYYIRPAARRRGLATQALRLALVQIAKVGVSEVMLTTNPDNPGSIRVIEENGGYLRAQLPDAEDGQTINQYWIELD